MSLRRLHDLRSLPSVIFLLALLIVLGGLVVLVQNEGNHSRAQQTQAEGLAEVLAASVTAAVDFGDAVAAKESVDAFRVYRAVRWIGVYDRGGNKLAGLGRDRMQAPPTLSSASVADDDFIRVSRPVTVEAQSIGTVLIEVDREAPARRLARHLLLGSLILIAALVVAGLGVTQAQLRSANHKLSQRAEALAQANLLLEDQMAQRADAEDRLRQSQKMQALGQLTGGIAHDFNNLLTVIQGSADILTRDKVEDKRRIKFAQAIVQAANNAAALTSQLLAFARRQPLKPEHIAVNELIRDMRDLLDRTLGERVEIVLELCELSCSIEADVAQLQSAILNIAGNARDAMATGGVLTISTAMRGDMVELAIADNGSGMDEDTIARVFEPFFTTKAAGKGTGLGLSQVYGFADQSGGDVRIESALGAGTCITLSLPCSVDQQSPEAPTQDFQAKPLPARLLVVEDNEQVGAFAEALLTDQGHDVVRASSAEEALELIRSMPFDLVFSDVVMPGMGGLRLAELLAKERPELPVILATGYSEELVRGGTGGRHFILKPYRLTTLLEAMAKVLPSSAHV
jgi:signal transduction histidine kinase